MNMSFSKRKFAFFAAFAVIPAAIWAAEIRPTLKERAGYVERQAKAGVVQADNKKLPGQRDRLSEAWEAFAPTVENALAELSDDLNPHLVQKRVFDIAREHGCTVKIARLSARDDENFLRFSLTGDGQYGAVVRFLDALEQGEHFVRFERLDLDLPGLAAMKGDRTVDFTGVMLIPSIPGFVQEANAR